GGPGHNVGGAVFKLNKDGSGYTELHRFGYAGRDFSAKFPFVEGDDGALYGTRQNDGSYKEGSVFKLNKDGSGYRVLLSFSRTDGYYPQALVEGSDGVLYGTTSFGGNGGCVNDLDAGCGTIFKLNKDGSGYTILHHFNSTGGDGQVPFAGLVEGSNGALYGTT